MIQFIAVVILIAVIALLAVPVFYIKLRIRQKKLTRFLYNLVNTITSARYGNLNMRVEEGFDTLTNQLSKNTNALLESILDRDSMIQEYIEKEKQSQNLKQDFISSLAHDFKVPIIAQDNTYDLFLQGKLGKLDDIQKSAVQNLKISNNDLKNLVMDLLDAHKLDTQELEPKFETTNVNDLIQEVIDQNKSILQIKGKVINFNPEKKVTYKLDPFLMKRVLNNLISNAVINGKNTKNIDIALKKTKDNVKISITDEGEGIKEDISALFKKYYTATKKYSNVGTGLGLYIANKIVLAHRGKLSAKNVDGKGACFTITL